MLCINTLFNWNLKYQKKFNTEKKRKKYNLLILFDLKTFYPKKEKKSCNLSSGINSKKNCLCYSRLIPSLRMYNVLFT